MKLFIPQSYLAPLSFGEGLGVRLFGEGLVLGGLFHFISGAPVPGRKKEARVMSKVSRE